MPLLLTLKRDWSRSCSEASCNIENNGKKSSGTKKGQMTLKFASANQGTLSFAKK